MQTLTTAIGTLAPMLATMLTALAGPPTITLLDVASGARQSYAYAISADGRTVVGAIRFLPGSRYRAFRWTDSGGMVDLGVLPGRTMSSATGVSADGSVVVGSSDSGNTSGPSDSRAFRWTAADGMQDLGVLTGGTSSGASSVSADGSVVAGSSDSSASVYQHATLWNVAGGMQDLGTLPDGTSSYALGLGADGAAIAGTNYFQSGASRAFRWTVAGGFQDLTPMEFGSALSADGAVVFGRRGVGYPFPFSPRTALRWNAASGVQGLRPPDGGFDPYLHAANADGSVAAGFAWFPGLIDYEKHAIRWNALGMVDLNTYLPSLGLDLTGWTLQDATGVSADGSAIAGVGSFNGKVRGFLVTGIPVCSQSVPSVTGYSIGGPACIGGTLNFSINASGEAPLQYRWRKNGLDLFDGAQSQGSLVQGAATAHLTIDSATALDSGDYSCVVATCAGSATAGPVPVTVGRLAGDANLDRIVNMFDLNIVMGQFGQIDIGLTGDVNGDGVVNFADLNLVLSNFGRAC